MASNALAGLSFTVSSTKVESTMNLVKLIKSNGGLASLTLTPKITHVISTPDEVKAGPFKLKRAVESGAKIVSEQYVLDSVKAGKALDDASYVLSAATAEKKESFFDYEKGFVAEAEAQQAVAQQRLKEDLEKSAAKTASAPKPAATASTSGSAGSFSFASGSSAPAQSNFSFTGYAAATALDSSLSSQASAAVARLADQEIAPPSTLSASVADRTRPPPTKIVGVVPKVKAYKDKEPSKPYFPADFTIDCYETLQWFDLQSNHNKYYVLELHRAEEQGRPYFRLYSHYGRTDDLVKNPQSGMRDHRFYGTLVDAENAFVALIQEKTMTKGYRKVSLVFSKVGSPQLQALMAQSSQKESKPHGFHEAPRIIPETSLQPEVQELVKFLYHEATAALASSLGPANITANGIETPLGVIGMAQIERGESILMRLFEAFKLGDHSSSEHQAKVVSLSNEFYTTIPHSVGGRDRSQISKALIDNMRAFEEKQELLQLMKDMLTVSQQTKASGVNLSDIDMKYFALGCKINYLEPGSDQFTHIQQYIMDGQVGEDRNQVAISGIYAVQRPSEWEAFSKCPVQHNRRLLYHGSRCSNFVGLLSRGVLMPKMVVAMGGKRRDAGLLGHGIYFGDSVTTSAQYTSLGSMRSSRLMLLNNVALGSVKDYTKVMFGLTEAPEGFHSVHGVKNTPETTSEFKDDEYVIFNTNQQQQEYLVEFRLTSDPAAIFTAPITKAQPKPTPTAAPAPSPAVAAPTTSSSTSAPISITETSSSSEPESLFNWPTAEPVKVETKRKLWTSSNSNPVAGTSLSGTSTNSGLLSNTLKLQSSGLQSSGLQSSGLTTTVNVPTSTSLRKSQQGSAPSSLLDPSPKKAKISKSPSTGALSSAALDVGDADEEERDAHRGVKRDAAGSDPTALLPSKKQKLRLSSGSQGGSSSTFALRTSGGGLVSPASAFETDSLRSSSESNQTTPLATAAGSIAKTAIQGLRTNLAPGAPMSKLQSLIGKDNAKLKHKEDKLRELFVKDRNNFLLSDPHAHLMDVYKTPTAFTQEFEIDEEIAIPKLLTKMRLPIRANESAILPTFQEFKKEFDSVTRNVFEDMDWKNVVVAGGAVLSSLLKLDEKDKAHFRDADVDLFLFGLSEEQAAQKVKDIFFQIQSRTNASCQIVRTRHAVTILGQYPNRHIQVILRLYKSPAEVLMGFDVDCCCVCYDGSAVWALPRAKRAITKRYNLVDMSRRSLTYETRLYKYAKRGFCVAVPGLQRQLVEPSIYDKRPWKVHGLAKLLIFENDVNTRAPRASRTSDPNAIWKPTNARHQRYQIYAKDEYTEDRINEFEAAENENTPDYSNIFLPWGPQWKLSKIMKHIEHRDKAFFFSGDSKRHMVLVGLDGVLEGKKPSWDKSEGTPNSLPKGAFVEGPIKFLTENPGRQLLSGSFHPVDDDSWFNDCYLNDPAKELVQHFVDASFGNRMDVLNTLVRKAGRQLDANVTDYFPQGRSALGYASLFNHGEVVRLLLDKGASFTAMDSSTGFQPIHYAAMAGHTSLFEVLAQKGARVSASTRDQSWTPLHFAAYYHHMDLLKVILNEYTSSIDLNAPDVQNRTPLFVAAMAGHLDAVQALKEASAKLDLKDISLVSPMEMAAKLGNRAVATYLISELKPQYPPVIQDIPMPAGAAQSSALFISEAISHDLFHAHDTAGQTILHYAVRTGEVHLVKKLVQARIKSGVEVEARFFRGIKFDVPAVSSDSKHVDVDAENIFGQTPLYYAHQLLSSVALPAGAPAPIGDSSNLFGLPKHDHLNNWLVIRELLVAAGASYPHLLYHRDLPEVKDDNMTNLVTRQAQAAKDEFKRLEAYELELERLFLEDAKKEQEKQKVSDHRSKKRRAASPPPQISDDSADLPFKAAAAAIPKATSASFSVGTGSIAASAPTSAYSTKYVETLSKAAAEPIEPFRPPETSPVSLTSAPTFTSLGSSSAISLSAFGGGSALGSTSSNLSAFGGSALSASSMMIGATPVKQQPRVASGAAPVQTARSTQILKSDIAILLARVISLAKANLITVAEKAVLKTLALQRDRHMIAALRAFQTDSDEEEFNDTLKSISALRAATPAF